MNEEVVRPSPEEGLMEREPIIDVVGKTDAGRAEGLEHDRRNFGEDAAGRSGPEREAQPYVDGPLPLESVVSGKFRDQNSVVAGFDIRSGSKTTRLGVERNILDLVVIS